MRQIHAYAAASGCEPSFCVTVLLLIWNYKLQTEHHSTASTNRVFVPRSRFFDFPSIATVNTVERTSSNPVHTTKVQYLACGEARCKKLYGFSGSCSKESRIAYWETRDSWVCRRAVDINPQSLVFKLVACRGRSAQPGVKIPLFNLVGSGTKSRTLVDIAPNTRILTSLRVPTLSKPFTYGFPSCLIHFVTATWSTGVRWIRGYPWAQDEW